MTEVGATVKMYKIFLVNSYNVDRCVIFPSPGPCKREQDSFACALSVAVPAQASWTVHPATLRKGYSVWVFIFDRVRYWTDLCETGNRCRKFMD